PASIFPLYSVACRITQIPSHKYLIFNDGCTRLHPVAYGGPVPPKPRRRRVPPARATPAKNLAKPLSQSLNQPITRNNENGTAMTFQIFYNRKRTQSSQNGFVFFAFFAFFAFKIFDSHWFFNGILILAALILAYTIWKPQRTTPP